jgi:hypothetical protein
MTAAAIANNGSGPISYSHVANLAFNLGGGVNNLTLDHVTYNLSQDNAISAGTNVTVNGGALNYNGHADAIGNLVIKNGGQVNAPSINNATTTVSSGTLTAGSIVCDTLTIGSTSGSASGAAAGSSQSPAVAASSAAVVRTTTASAAIVAAPPAASEISSFTAEIPQLASLPIVIAAPQDTIAVAVAGDKSASPQIPAAVQSELPVTPLSTDSFSAITLDPIFNILGSIGRIADRTPSNFMPSMSFQPSVILAEMPSAPPTRAFAMPNGSSLQSLLHDTIFEQMFEKKSAEDTAADEQTIFSDLEQTLVHRQTAKNQRQAVLAVDALFSE